MDSIPPEIFTEHLGPDPANTGEEWGVRVCVGGHPVEFISPPTVDKLSCLWCDLTSQW